MFDLKHAIANLADYGLVARPWIPQRQHEGGAGKYQIGGGKVRPLIGVADGALATFRQNWPNADAILNQALNGGQSLRVKNQGTVRNAVDHDSKVTDEQLVEKQLSSMLGIRYTPPAEMSDESLIAELARRKGITVEEARALFQD